MRRPGNGLESADPEERPSSKTDSNCWEEDKGMRLLKRVLLVILSVICVIVVGILAFAATPLSACKFPDIASDVSSVGEGEAGENTASRLVTDHVRYTEASDHTQIAYRTTRRPTRKQL